MKNILYCIVVHDIKIIQHFEKIKKYKSLLNYKYILVGDQDELHTSDKIIQANIQPNNIESLKNYLAYTGWWAFGKNLLDSFKEEYIFFLEYDTNISNSNLVEIMENNILLSNFDVIGIDTLPTNVCFDEFFDPYITQLMNYKDSGYWLVTNNICFRRSALKQFINSSELLQVFKHLNNGEGTGHALERYTTIYSSSKGFSMGVIDPVCFQHLAMDSHGSQGRSQIYKNFRDSI
jgi:hypothetical protein